MAHDHEEHLNEPKDFEASGQFKMACIAMAVIGFGAFAVAQFAGYTHAAWNGYLIGFWFTLGLGLSGPFIVATQHLSKAGWSASIRRLPESFGAFLIPAFLFGILGVFGGDHLFHWFDHEYVIQDPILSKKIDFYNPTTFGIATFGILAALNLLWFFLRQQSVKQDEDGSYDRTNRMKALSAIFLFAFVVGWSVLTWHWIMGLSPHWFSTMFQVYTFAGLFQSGLALTAILVIYLRERGDFGDFVGDRQVHDLGQLIFGFTVFYAYIGFSQFLLIWYANIPEEAIWFVARGTPPDVNTGWGIFSLALPILKFVIPFLILLPQVNKKNKYNILKYVAYGLLFVQLYEVWYWVAPTPHEEGALAAPLHLPLVELLVVIGFVGVFGYTVARALGSANLVPKKDPYLHESIPHHHHGVKPPEPDHIEIS